MQATDRFWPLARWATVVAGLLLGAVAALAQLPTPGRVTVSDVQIQGSRVVPPEELRGRLKTRPGQEYLPEVVGEDVRALYNTRQFANVYADRVADGPDKVKVIFYIRDLASTVEKVEYRGNRSISRDDLDGVAQVRKGAPLNPYQNKVACRKVVAKYNEEGRPFASCDLLKGGEAGDTEVIFNITEGPKVRVRAIQFTGNTFLSGPVLKTHINSSTKFLGLPLGGTYNSALVEQDLNDLLKYYRSFGYHDVAIARELRYSPDGRDVTIIYHIHEGVRYVVQGTPTIHGAKSVPPEELEAKTKVKPNEFYDQRKVDGDVNYIESYFGYQGRKTRVQAIPVWSKDTPGVVTVNYEVQERPPAKVGQIFIVGNERTRMNVILRQLPLYPGQVLTYPDLRLAERNLARLGIFESSPDGGVHPTVVPLENPLDPDNPVKDILVTVQEANTGSLLFGIGVNSDSGLTGSIVLNERNFDLFRPPVTIDDFFNGTAFRGAGQEFRAEAVPGTQLQRYTVSLKEPFLFDSPYSLTVSGYYYQRLFNEYQEEREGFRATIGRRLNNYWQASAGFRIENVNVNTITPGAPADFYAVQGDNLLIGFRGGVTYDTRDSFLRATSGDLLDISYEQIVGSQTYPLVNVDYSRYFTTYQRADGSGRHVLALHSQFGWAGSEDPIFERFYAGGFRTLRGFQFRGVGPDINGFKVGGDFLLLNSLEYQIPVVAGDNVFLVGFVDSGTVTPRINSIDDYRVSAGFGFRFTVPMLGPVPIALDFGFPIVKGPADNTQVFNFWMGFFR